MFIWMYACIFQIYLNDTEYSSSLEFYAYVKGQLLLDEYQTPCLED